MCHEGVLYKECGERYAMARNTETISTTMVAA